MAMHEFDGSTTAPEGGGGAGSPQEDEEEPLARAQTINEQLGEAEGIRGWPSRC